METLQQARQQKRSFLLSLDAETQTAIKRYVELQEAIDVRKDIVDSLDKLIALLTGGEDEYEDEYGDEDE